MEQLRITAADDNEKVYRILGDLMVKAVLRRECILQALAEMLPSLK